LKGNPILKFFAAVAGVNYEHCFKMEDADAESGALESQDAPSEFENATGHASDLTPPGESPGASGTIEQFPAAKHKLRKSS
jgi:hypothetical protein